MAEVIGNFAQVQAALVGVALRVEVADEEVEETAAHIVAAAAAVRAPKLTGHMAASVGEEGGQVVVDTPYAGYQEFGTRRHKAQPFLRPARDMSFFFNDTATAEIYTIATR